MTVTTITGFRFDSADGADRMVRVVQGLARQELVTLLDAATVSWPEGKSKPKTKHLGDMTGEGALGGAFWGMLFGLIFFVPFLGMAVGAALGALTGHFSNYGIDKDFIEAARDKVTEGTSALFLMTADAVTDRVTDAIRDSGLDFELFYTNLSKEQEAQLREDFGSA
jgi:uncharacterized membrane protein